CWKSSAATAWTRCCRASRRCGARACRTCRWTMWSGGLATNIVLAGFMGAGKTTVGRLVAHRLGWPFVDADDEIVARAGMSIPEIFARYGEAHFRQIEREVCAELARREHTVIATGGGALVDETNLKTMLASGLVVCLRVSAEAV